MLFNSLQFAVFFPIVVVAYFLIPHRVRWFFLLLSSCVFYMAFVPAYILILATTITVDYFVGIYLEQSQGRKKKILLVLSLISNVGFLAFFKYFNFFNANIADLAHFLHWNYSVAALQIALPIGLSFHTFQAMSYIIEVYRGKQKAERHFGIYALYVMFFPQLVAGPIERPQNLLHQFYEKHVVDLARMRSGAELMLWGFIKKMVIADNLAPGVNVVFNNPTDFNGTALTVATIFFAYQIYCDFSGYSDIARGAARILGFRLMVNFNNPYSARSISEFWVRWHISLSTWFRDYVYISLGGNRVSVARWCTNIFIVFLISGFWHGANWTFIIWGALHGFYFVVSILTRNLRKTLNRVTHFGEHTHITRMLGVATTFVLVNLGWIFFRANSVGDAVYIVTHLFSNVSFDTYFLSLTKGKMWLIFCVTLIAGLEVVQYLQRAYDINSKFKNQSELFRWLAYAAAALVLFMGTGTEGGEFIYFQF